LRRSADHMKARAYLVSKRIGPQMSEGVG
jgi:hypothetical protein